MPGAAKNIAERYGIKSAVIDYKEILDNPEIEAVIICSPTNTHAQYIIETSKAGKHIFCEKPIDLSVARIKESIKAAQDANVKLMVGFNRRFDPNFAGIKNAVVEGKAGVPHIIKITSRDPQPPNIDYVKISGGIFLDMTIHDFDMARFLAGSEVTEVYAKANVLVDSAIGDAGDVDTAVITMTFESGAIGVIDNSRKAVYGYDQRVEVFGSEGMIAAANNRYDNNSYLNKDGEHLALPLNFFMDRYTEAYYREMKAFVRSIFYGEPLPVSGNDGLKSVEIALAAKKSVIENRPVKISEVANN
jgi:myo-inositol 2-dehydrogenase/D-chiro-inositol 1-dehydrogenase